MAKNYYEILGVNSDATQEQIKSAYRRQVKKLHPDHYGEDQGPFLAVQEAYDTLSDPKRRNAYDSNLNRRSRPRPRNVNPAEPLRPRQAPVEPLIPHDEPNDFEQIFFKRPVRSPFDEIFDHFWNHVDPPGAPHPGGREYFDVELSLTPEQAQRGGQARLALPIESICPTCRGGGGAAFFVCRRCLGQGTISDEYPLLITFPAGIPHQHIETLPLDRAGLRNVYLRVHFNVGG